MRKRIGSVIIKIFAFLLILGFGAWGIQDMLGYQVGGGGSVAQVGDVRMGPNKLYRDVGLEIQRMRPLLGKQLDMETAHRLGVVDMVLNREVSSIATILTTQSLGIAISDRLVRAEVTSRPAFIGLGGNFDHRKFRAILRQAGLSEDDYIAEVRGALASDFLLGSVEAGASPPKSWVNRIYRYREETRDVDSIVILDQSSNKPTIPTDAQLRQSYTVNKDIYTAPEYRAISYVQLSAMDLAKEISISDDELRRAYDEREEEFSVDEKREIRQLILADEDTAKRAAERVKNGGDFILLAKEIAGLDPTTVELGLVSKSDLLSELADPVFTAGLGTTVGPLKSALGWHLIQVISISEGRTASFEEVIEKLRAEVAREKAIDGLYEISNQLEDILGGGASIEEAARELGVGVRKIIAMDAQGRDRGGAKIVELPGEHLFVNSAFSTELSEESALQEVGEDGFFLLRVDQIIKPALRPFAQVRRDVSHAWVEEQRRLEAEKFAIQSLKTINSGAGVENIGDMETIQGIYRDGRTDDQRFGPALISKVFKLKVGEATMGRVEGGYRIVLLKKITEPNPHADKKGANKLAEFLTNSIRGDIASQLRKKFQKDADVKIHQAEIDHLFNASRRK
tara:strand:+ start:600 stop:2477 length:1878 start_codon:yes stop_codon:yes gene_type:complete